LNGTPGYVIRSLFVSKDVSESITNRMTYETIALEMRRRLKNAFAVSSAITKIGARTAPEHQSFAEALVNRFSSLDFIQAKSLDIASDFPLRELISDLVGAAGRNAEAFDVSRLPERRTANRTVAIRTPDQEKTAIQVHWMAVGARPNVRGGGAWPAPVPQRFAGGGEGPLGNSGYAPSSECACNERYHQKDEENDEQELCDARSGAGDAAEAKQSSDDRQYEKCQGPAEHVCLHFFVPDHSGSL
jgi:hypothetical protein